MNEEKLFFDSGYGLRLCGILVNSTGKFDRVVILVHGFSSDKNGRMCTAMYNEFAARDIASFRIDLHGMGESEGDFAQTTITKMILDVEAAIAVMKEKGFSRIDLLGSSCGGITCMGVALKHPEIGLLGLQCPVSDYPAQKALQYGEQYIADWKSHGYMFFVSGRKGELRVNYSFLEDSEKYIMRDHVSNISCPVLIVHGDADTSVPIEQSREIVTYFPHAKLVEIPGAEHDMEVNGDRSETNRLFGEFFSSDL